MMASLSEHDQSVVDAIFDPYQKSALAPSSVVDDSDDENEEAERLDPEVLQLLKKAIRHAEENDIAGCLDLFDEAVKRAPNSSTVLNDRAQALRLAGRDKEALEDLHAAVRHSKGRGKAGTQALCQRGILYSRMGMDVRAKEDFRLAAKRGSEFASSQLIALDPYAAMGNAVLREIVQLPP